MGGQSRSKSSEAGAQSNGRSSRRAEEEEQEWRGASGRSKRRGRAVEEEQEQFEAGGRSNGRGRTRGLLDQLVHRPRRTASGCDGCPRPIISGVL
jgi:hypothetical protein